VHSTLPALKGMAVTGPYLPEFEELLRFAANEIPFSDGLILIPGEDPFYFATGRTPQFPVLLFDNATDPLYSPAQLVEGQAHDADEGGSHPTARSLARSACKSSFCPTANWAAMMSPPPIAPLAGV
jgi:hypothetical protein